MTYENLLLEIHRSDEDNCYASLTLNRPDQKNALSTALRDDLIDAFQHIATDDRIKLVLLAGSGACFCSGFDLKEALDTDLQSFDYRFRDFFDALYAFPKPLIVVVHGYAFAGGFDTALAGDIIIAEKESRFGHPEIHFGVSPLISPLLHKIPAAKAFEMATMGSIIDADEALRMGLVNRIVAGDTLEKEKHTFAAQMAKTPLKNLVHLKKIMKSHTFMDHETATYIELNLFRRLAHNKTVYGKLEKYIKGMSEQNR